MLAVSRLSHDIFPFNFVSILQVDLLLVVNMAALVKAIGPISLFTRISSIAAPWI